jgi:hypothetical protein
MSFAERAKTPIHTSAKILILDIERVMGTAEVQFWDLGQFKNQRIHADTVTSWPRSICAAWKWHDKAKVHFAAEWEPAGYEAFMRATWAAYDQADIVVGHNLNSFDTKKLKTGWAELDLGSPSPWRTVDTLTVARREFGAESNTLDALCKRFGLVAKTDRYNHGVASAACAGHRPSQQQIKRYNQGDVVATQALYDFLRPWDKTHPHLGLYDGEERSCFACGSTDLHPDGDARTALTAYARYRCSNCGAYSRTNFKHRVVTMRPVAR